MRKEQSRTPPARDASPTQGLQSTCDLAPIVENCLATGQERLKGILPVYFSYEAIKREQAWLLCAMLATAPIIAINLSSL